MPTFFLFISSWLKKCPKRGGKNNLKMFATEIGLNPNEEMTCFITARTLLTWSQSKLKVPRHPHLSKWLNCCKHIQVQLPFSFVWIGFLLMIGMCICTRECILLRIKYVILHFPQITIIRYILYCTFLRVIS